MVRSIDTEPFSKMQSFGDVIKSKLTLSWKYFASQFPAKRIWTTVKWFEIVFEQSSVKQNSQKLLCSENEKQIKICFFFVFGNIIEFFILVLINWQK